MNTKPVTHLPVLDGLRGIAVLLVVLFHVFLYNTAALGDHAETVMRFAVFGQTGVDLFFVLSGFLITRILLSSRNQKNQIKNFYIRRFLRIFPLYYLFLILIFYILPQLGLLKDDVNLIQKLSYFFYFQGIRYTWFNDFSGPMHFWSLAVEEHFYLFWPFIVSLLSFRNLVFTSIILIIISVLFRYFLKTNGYSDFYFTICRLDSLALGAIISMIEVKNISSEKVRKVAIFLFLITTLMISCLFISKHIFHSSDLIASLKFTLIGMFYFSIILYLLNSNKSIIGSIINLGVFSFCGKISYGIYVYHPLCLTLFKQLNLGFLWYVTLSISVTIIISWISYNYFEILFLKLKHRWT